MSNDRVTFTLSDDVFMVTWLTFAGITAGDVLTILMMSSTQTHRLVCAFINICYVIKINKKNISGIILDFYITACLQTIKINIL